MYMYKKDLALDNLQWLICHKTKWNPDPNWVLLLLIRVDLKVMLM